MPAGNTNRSHQHRLATTQTQEGKKPSLPPKPDDFSALIPRAQAATTRAGARQGRPRAVPSRSCRAFLCPAVRHRCSPPLMRNPKLTRGHCWDRSIICSLPGASLPAWTTGIFICGWPASGEGHGLGRDEQDPGKVSWIFASFQGYQGKVLQRGNPERGSSKMCPSILETGSSPSLKGLERVGSPSSPYFLAAEGKELLDRSLCLRWMSLDTPPPALGGFQSGHIVFWSGSGTAGTSPPCPAIRARLRAEGLAVQGCISPWPPGLGGSGPFPVFPTRSCPVTAPVISTSHSQQPGTDVSPGAFRRTPGPVFSIHCSVSFPTTMEERRKNQRSYKPFPPPISPPLKARRMAKRELHALGS